MQLENYQRRFDRSSTENQKRTLGEHCWGCNKTQPKWVSARRGRTGQGGMERLNWAAKQRGDGKQGKPRGGKGLGGEARFFQRKIISSLGQFIHPPKGAGGVKNQTAFFCQNGKKRDQRCRNSQTSPWEEKRGGRDWGFCAAVKTSLFGGTRGPWARIGERDSAAKTRKRCTAPLGGGRFGDKP